MLVEPELATRSQDPPRLVEHATRIGDAAQDAGEHHGVHRRVRQWYVLGEALTNLHGDRSTLGCLHRSLTQSSLGFDRNELRDRAWVVGERDSAPGTDLYHTSRQAAQQLTTPFRASATLLDRTRPSLYTCEHRTLPLAHRTTVSDRPQPTSAPRINAAHADGSSVNGACPPGTTWTLASGMSAAARSPISGAP